MNRYIKILLAFIASILGIYYIFFENKAEIGLLLIILGKLEYGEVETEYRT